MGALFQGFWSFPGLLGDSIAAYAGGTSELKNILGAGGQSPALRPMKLDTSLGLSVPQRDEFARLVNQKPFFKGGSVRTMNHIKIAQRFREKHAGMTTGSLLSEVIRPGLQSILYGLGAGVLGNTLYEKIQDMKRSREAYQDMFVRFPEIAELPRQQVDDYWNLMQQYAPSMTRNPLVAGQFVKNMADYNLKGVDFPTLKAILDIESAANKKQTDSLNLLIKGIGSSVD